MKRIIFLWVFIFVGFTTQARIVRDSNRKAANKPKIQVKVNKVYDKNGNIVRYDSTYTWSYSSDNNGRKIDVDSLMSRFMPYLRGHLPDALAKEFSNPDMRSNDSALILDFFNDEHFFNKWQTQLFDFPQQLREMDSLKREFIRHYLPNKEKNKRERLKAGIY